MPGVFISFEGPDGSGKTTLIKGLKARLDQDLKQAPIFSREPGGDRIAEEIRDIILSPVNTELDARSEALLYAASRAQHLAQKIRPALAAGNMVLCDRYVDSSIAYQGYGRKLGGQAVQLINAFAIDGLLPDLTLYCDISAEEGIARIEAGRTNEINRLDQESIAFHRRVVQGYQDLLKENPDRIVPIDASQPAEAMQAAAYELIRQRFPQFFS
ncbi:MULTISPECIES: dTMP kinase [Aerococcus]|uniref:dTMP kinase n=1 Tax=Aerococcus urinae (strain CCUG 59500 / ACS-120-V-Col10a) TaxID=2976812 RepID=UPI00227ABCB5|nr:dTMP kinase [Aerococcus sp. Group 1]MCY3031414.1 dTMP kinase [Aerococcus sp. Group 1]MCY3054273.1 dTMP kinase [Aerococcus sp. Group 1]MCY3056003.1 dTMP kinase [Aerococcus sp. Group 1]MCY3062095.1 dTMP kinase [Aerococcus sp. Group 1]